VIWWLWHWILVFPGPALEMYSLLCWHTMSFFFFSSFMMKTMRGLSSPLL
jgi:hypothetical protein